MDASDRARLESYVRSQNYFQGLGEYAVERALTAFIERVMPWLVDELCNAVQAAWDWIRRRTGW